MFRRFSVNYALLSIVIDLLFIALSLAAATHARPFFSEISFIREMSDTSSVPWIIYIIFPITWSSILMLFSVYDSRKNLKYVDEFSRLTLGSILAAVSMAGILFLSYRETSRFLFLSFFILGYLLLGFWRIVARLAFRLTASRPESKQNVLIVGTGTPAREIYTKIDDYPFYGITITGFLEDNPTNLVDQGQILGTLPEAKRIIRELKISDVVIALPQDAHQRVNDLVVDLHSLPVKVWVIPDYFNLALHTAVIDDFAGLPMLDLRAPVLNDYQRLVKRAFDLLLTIIFLPFALVLAFFIAALIRLENRGSILFKQERVGENGRIFTMYKFRTMVPGAESQRSLVEKLNHQDQLVYKTQNDPRVTRMGNILRKTSLDELPQLINILKGEMSMVGPRPELPYLVDLYEPWQRKRFSVPQGITGWWQVHGRSEKPMHLHTEEDLYYVQNYSLLLDLYILLKTIIVVLGGKGAY